MNWYRPERLNLRCFGPLTSVASRWTADYCPSYDESDPKNTRVCRA